MNAHTRLTCPILTHAEDDGETVWTAAVQTETPGETILIVTTSDDYDHTTQIISMPVELAVRMARSVLAMCEVVS